MIRMAELACGWVVATLAGLAVAGSTQTRNRRRPL